MAKRGPIAIVCLAGAMLAGLALMLRHEPVADPVYNGKTLSHWLVVLTDADNKADRERAALAVQSIGTNGFPKMLEMLRETESPFKSRLLAWRWYDFFSIVHFWQPADSIGRAYAGFYALGTNAVAAVPGLTEVVEEDRFKESADHAVEILGNIGPGAKAAIPALLRAALEPSRREHYDAIMALGKIHSQAETVVPLLTSLVHSHSPDRMYAVIALGKFGGDAAIAVPDLMAMLSDPTVKTTSPRGTGFVTDHEQVERALEQIDPKTHAEITAKTADKAEMVK